MPGFEVFLGRYFNCGRNAITASYWGLFPEDEMATVTMQVAWTCVRVTTSTM